MLAHGGGRPESEVHLSLWIARLSNCSFTSCIATKGNQLNMGGRVGHLRANDLRRLLGFIAAQRALQVQRSELSRRNSCLSAIQGRAVAPAAGGLGQHAQAAEAGGAVDQVGKGKGMADGGRDTHIRRVVRAHRNAPFFQMPVIGRFTGVRTVGAKRTYHLY